MCGSTSGQQQISDSQQQMYQTLNQNYATTFGQDQAITSALTAQFQPILAAGPNQQGFSPGETQALNTGATENIAQNYAQAQKATAQQLAARGGGNTLLPSSVSANILAQGTNAAAAQRASAQNTIQQASYAQGYQNWQQAAGVLSNTAGLINPLGYAGASTGAGTAAANTANQIAQQQNSIWNAAIGALGSVGGAALGNPAGLTSLFSKSTPSTGNLMAPLPQISNYGAIQNLAPPPLAPPGLMGSPSVPSF
jgi:hypothetical protein